MICKVSSISVPGIAACAREGTDTAAPTAAAATDLPPKKARRERDSGSCLVVETGDRLFSEFKDSPHWGIVSSEQKFNIICLVKLSKHLIDYFC